MNPLADSCLLRPASPLAARRARAWLWLATLAVAASSLFAILIVLARVPAIGKLLPGTEFYRVVLTLHVNLSQLVWFSAFAGMLWSLASPDRRRRSEPLALGCCAAGALAMAVTPSLGAVTPIMSNYLPVLDSPLFLGGALVFGAGLALQAWRGARLWPTRLASAADAGRAGLSIAAVAVLLALAFLPVSGAQITQLSEAAFFEFLFWASGHVWEFALTTLMMLAWLGLAGTAVRLSPRAIRRVLVAGALPLAMAVLIELRTPALSAGYLQAFTDLMRYASWEVPLLLGALLLAAGWRQGRRTWQFAIFRLSLGLFAAGLLIGAAISGQTTVVTAHYHGTIGAVTLSFMGLTYALLPALGLLQPRAAQMRRQAACYGFGNLLMMLGLAGAGLMGAPRKAAGNVGLDFGFEMFSRVVMGLGGTLAMIGIIGFFVLVARALRLPRQADVPLHCAASR
jgi:hypothetical protein